MNIHLTFFGDETFKFGKERLHQQAEDFSIFKSIQEFGEADLNDDFWINHASKMMQKRATQPLQNKFYGYYAVKPHFVSKALERIPEDDVLLFVDAGCELNFRGINRLQEYYELTMDKNGLFFSLDYPEIMWTKMDTYSRVFGDNDEHFMTNQFISGAYLIKNNSFIRDFVHTWENICIENNGMYLDDSPSVSPNHSIFKEHRHDQSILSLLLKAAGDDKFAFLTDDTYENIWQANGVNPPPNWEEESKLWNEYGEKFPIWACRNGRNALIYTRCYKKA